MGHLVRALLTWGWRSACGVGLLHALTVSAAGGIAVMFAFHASAGGGWLAAAAAPLCVGGALMAVGAAPLITARRRDVATRRRAGLCWATGGAIAALPALLVLFAMHDLYGLAGVPAPLLWLAGCLATPILVAPIAMVAALPRGFDPDAEAPESERFPNAPAWNRRLAVAFGIFALCAAPAGAALGRQGIVPADAQPWYYGQPIDEAMRDSGG